MKKDTTILVLCGLMMVVVALWFGRTIEIRETAESSVVIRAFIVQTSAVVGILAIAARAFCRSSSATRKSVSRSGAGLLHPLRRLFVSVWP